MKKSFTYLSTIYIQMTDALSSYSLRWKSGKVEQNDPKFLNFWVSSMRSFEELQYIKKCSSLACMKFPSHVENFNMHKMMEAQKTVSWGISAICKKSKVKKMFRQLSCTYFHYRFYSQGTFKTTFLSEKCVRLLRLL
jgi:hypothetical protein